MIGESSYPMVDRIDRYIIRVFTSSYLVAFLFFFGAFVVIDLFANIDDFIETAQDMGVESSELFRRVCGYYLYGSPAVFLQVAPFVTVIGVIVTVARLQQSNEMIPILMSGLHVQGILVGCRDDFSAMNKAISACQLLPVVDRVFPFEETLQAFELMQRGGHFGKIVISFGP